MSPVCVIFIICGLATIDVKAQDCADDLFGPRCQFRCNCWNQRCNRTTGECFGDKRCKGGYFGPACQYLSQAYNMPAAQLSTASGGDASRAVDGDTESCSATERQNRPYWYVDMPFRTWLTWVDIHFPPNDRSGVVDLLVDGDIKCDAENTWLTTTLLRVTCRTPLNMTRLVIVGTENDMILSLCEVLVYGGRNMALLKQANQSSEYIVRYPASLAVDGISSTDFSSGSCTHTSDESCHQGTGTFEPWWRVDFEAHIRLYRAVVYNRGGSNSVRLEDFRMRVSKPGKKFSKIYRDRNVPPKIVTHILMPANQTGNVMEILLRSDCRVLTLCEVQAFGDCLDRKYGLLCQKNCSCRNRKEVCGKIDGSCVSGCADGITGTDCKNDCPDGTYGRNCSRKCSVNCIDEICDKVTGNCSCLPGWKGDKCTITCDPGTYGPGCRQRCSRCADEECLPTNGTCLSGCASGFAGPQCLQGSAPDSSSTGAIIGSVLVILLLAVLVFLLWRYRDRIRQLHKTATKNGSVSTNHSKPRSATYENVDVTTKDVDNISEATDELNNHVDNTMETVMEYQNVTLDRARLVIDDRAKEEPEELYVNRSEGGHVIDVADLQSHMIAWRQNGNILLEEFKSLPRDLQADIPHRIGQSEANQKKNRYKNICAYDHSRVKLTPFPGNKASDYINANYIKGYTENEKFIASQGPTKKMIDDFIRMLWELEIPIVLMLTNVVEEGKRKCEQYWDDDEEMDIGDFIVEATNRKQYAHFTVRTLHISEACEPGVSKTVQHYHYTAWPDKSVPASPWSLIDFRNTAMKQDRAPGYIVVHCSAGVGRTGTFIALDTIMRMADEVGHVDIYDCVERMRKSRVNMVQTLDQYVLLHEALTLSTLLPPVKDCQTFLDDIYLQDDALMTTEFMNLSAFVGPTAVKFSATMKTSESMASLADDAASLASVHTELEDYSETVYVPSFFHLKGFMLMDCPDVDSAEDFYSWMCDFQPETIVTIDHLNPDFWPEDGEVLEFEQLKVTCTWVEKMGVAVRRKYTILREDQEHEFVQMTCPGWADSTNLCDTPPLVLHFVGEVRGVTSAHPLVLMSSPAHGEGGVFCCVWNLIEEMVEGRGVSVPHVISVIRANSISVIRSVAEYKLCYDCARCFLQTNADDFGKLQKICECCFLVTLCFKCRELGVNN